MKGLLLVNLGTPDSPKRSDVRKYLKQFLLDPRVIDIPWLPRQLLVRGIIAPFRSGSSAKLYKELWTENGSPLKYYGEEIAKKVQQESGDSWKVVLAMRYQQPSIEAGIQTLLDHDVEEIVVFPMFPQYASATTGSVHEEVMRLLSREQLIPKVTLIDDYYAHPQVMRIFAKHADQFNLEDYDHVLFSYHGLPERQLVKADRNEHCMKSSTCCQQLDHRNRYCYSAQCFATTRSLVELLELHPGQYTTCFQSRLGRAEWLKPYTSDILKVRAEQGDKSLLVFCPAFTADCLETIIEISTEYGEEWHELGGERIDLVPSLNDDPDWAKAIFDIAINDTKSKSVELN